MQQDGAVTLRNDEGQRLPRPRLGSAQHVAAAQDVRQRGALDGGQRHIASLPEPVQRVPGQGQLFQAPGVRIRRAGLVFCRLGSHLRGHEARLGRALGQALLQARDRLRVRLRLLHGLAPGPRLGAAPGPPGHGARADRRRPGRPDNGGLPGGMAATRRQSLTQGPGCGTGLHVRASIWPVPARDCPPAPGSVGGMVKTLLDGHS